MSYLYAGTILKVDLSSGKISREPTSSYAKGFLGGRGINIKLLCDNISPGVDPLGPDNVLIFGVGPLGGTSLSTGRTEVTAKSPATGYLGSSNFGGYFGAELKFAGYDHLMITGRAAKPVYIWIDNERVEIMDASSFWGKDTYEFQDILRNELNNPEAKIACIGPGGENLVRFATIQHGLANGAGRTGMGAVMGSKNLKAIAVRGTKGLQIADPKKFLTIVAELEQIIKNSPECQQVATEGVSRYQDDFIKEEAGVAAWFTNGAPAVIGSNVPSMHAIYKKHPTKRAGCYGCAIQCMDYFDVDGPGRGVISCQLYADLGPVLKCFDSDTSLECAVRCMRYGVDCISVGGIIRWLMELYENGIITKDDTDGISMEWGNPEAIRGMLDKMTFRKGIGDVLAEGILPAAREIGRNSEEYANHTKGMPMVEGHHPTWMPHFKGGSLAEAVGSRGDTMRSLSPVGTERHMPPEFAKEVTGTEKAAMPQSYEGKPELVLYMEDVIALCDLLSTCKWLSPFTFGVLAPEHQAALYSAGSGTETSVETLFEFAHKVRTLERAYEAGEGISREKDTLPKRFVDNPIPLGPWKGETVESEKLEEMKTRYYELRGWDVKTGIPTEETLKELGLDDVAANLKKLGKLPTSAGKEEKKK